MEGSKKIFCTELKDGGFENVGSDWNSSIVCFDIFYSTIVSLSAWKK